MVDETWRTATILLLGLIVLVKIWGHFTPSCNLKCNYCEYQIEQHIEDLDDRAMDRESSGGI